MTILRAMTILERGIIGTDVRLEVRAKWVDDHVIGNYLPLNPVILVGLVHYCTVDTD